MFYQRTLAENQYHDNPVIGEYDQLLASLAERKIPEDVYYGARKIKNSYLLIRATFAKFNGHFGIKFLERPTDLCVINVERRTIRGLHPMTIDELVVYIVFAIRLAFVDPSPQFIREVILLFFEGSFLHTKLPRVVSLLDAWGVVGCLT